MGRYAGRQRGWLWPVVITLLGAFLRWYRLGDTRLLWDDAYPLAQAIRLLQSGVWPTLGQPTSFFLSNPPGQAYVSLLPVLVFHSFWLAVWFITTLNVLAVPLLYRCARGAFSETTALLAAFLFATSPAVINFSRASWSSSLLPVGGVLVLGLLLRALAPTARRRSLSLLAALTTLTVLGQTYLLALILLPVQAAGVLLVRWRAIPWRGLAAGAAVFLIGLACYGAAVAANWPTQVFNARRLGQDSSTPASIRVEPLEIAVSYVSGQNGYDTALPPAVTAILEWALVLALAVGIGRAAGRLLRRQGAWADGALLAWWLIPVAALSYNSAPLAQWHLLSTLPAGQLLAAAGITWLAQRWPSRLTKPLWVAVAGGLALASFAAVNLTTTTEAARPGPGQGARLDQITLNASQQMGALLDQAMQQYHVAELYSDLPDVVPTAWVGRPVDTVTWGIEGTLLILPDDRPALYVRTAWGAPPAQLPYANRVRLQTWPGDGFTALDLIPAVDRAQAAALPDIRLDWPSDTGLTLLGYRLDTPLRAGETSVITTFWRIDTLTATRGQFIFGPYMHLVSKAGALLMNASAPGLPGYYYRQGDLYIENVTVAVPGNLPAGIYDMDLGLYDGLHTAGTMFYPDGEAPAPFYRTEVAVR